MPASTTPQVTNIIPPIVQRAAVMNGWLLKPRIRYVRQFVMDTYNEREHRYDMIARNDAGAEQQFFVEFFDKHDWTNDVARDYLRTMAQETGYVPIDPSEAKCFKLRLPVNVPSEYI